MRSRIGFCLPGEGRDPVFFWTPVLAGETAGTARPSICSVAQAFQPAVFEPWFGRLEETVSKAGARCYSWHNCIACCSKSPLTPLFLRGEPALTPPLFWQRGAGGILVGIHSIVACF